MTLGLRLLTKFSVVLDLLGVGAATRGWALRRLLRPKRSQRSAMLDPSGEAWCEAFAFLYAAHMRCSAVDAQSIAQMVHPVLKQMSPEQALQTVTTSPAFIDS